MGSVDDHILGINSDMGEGFGLNGVGDVRAPMAFEVRTQCPTTQLRRPFRRAERDAFSRSPREQIGPIGGAKERIPLSLARRPETSQAER